MDFVTIESKNNGCLYHGVLLCEYEDVFFVAIKFESKREIYCYCDFNYWNLIKNK